MATHARGDQETIVPDQVTPPGTEVDVTSNEAVEPDAFGKWIIDQQSQGTDPDVDPYQQIIEQVLAAETPDDVLTPVVAIAAKDLVGINLLLHDVNLNKSEFDVGSPFYASCHVVRQDTGETIVVNCGHKKVLAQLIKLDQFAQYPYQVKFIEQGRSKQSGSPMLALAKWEFVGG